MKKLLLLTFTLFLMACGSKGNEDEVVLKVGGTYPLIEIFNEVADDLEEEGIKLQVIEFNDYITPNIALNDGEIDANLFQHIPYLEGFNENRGTELINIANVLIAPIGIYSEKYESIFDLPEGAIFGITNSAVEQGRSLLILQEEGFIKLDPSKGIEADLTDIIENPKNINFKPLDAAMLARSLKDLDVAFINGNFAIQAGLKPSEDAIYREGGNSPYVNVIAIKKDRVDDENLKKLADKVQSDKVREFINNNFDGAFVPAF